MWRPKENWVNPYGIKIYGAFVNKKESEYKAFEAGADAMLEALKKKAIHIRHPQAGWVDVTSNLSEIAHDMGIYGKAGYLTFIPEEEVKECLKKL